MGSFLSPASLQDLLREASVSYPQRSLIVYPLGNTSTPIRVSYESLYAQALRASQVLLRLPGLKPGAPVLLHLDNHWDTILWFWATLLANALAVPSSPFSNVEDHRRKHIQGLSSLLESPICITRAKAVKLFDCDHNMRLYTVESLLSTPVSPDLQTPPPTPNTGLAMLMLTSGSTGNAKAVQLDHVQILAAIAGKASVRQLSEEKPFLNWIGLDHVASLVEIHLQAMHLGVDQVHVHAADIVSSPLTFLDLLSRHQVTRSFAPNFFLAKLVSQTRKGDNDPGRWDLHHLRVMASGGEANDVQTCIAASTLFSEHGAPSSVITPGFGMTETCAGAIFSLNCPEYDIKHQRAFASLGRCMRGIEMRVTVATVDDGVRLASPDEPGSLEVRGDVVFRGYYRNEKATAQAFRPGGWFRTGDKASIDPAGNLNLLGRADDTMNINGVKISPAGLQTSLEHALAGHVSCGTVFPVRASGASTEQIAVVYVPMKSPLISDDALHIRDIIASVSIAATGTQPVVFAVVDETKLPRTTLGKLSRAKLRTMFENGHFASELEHHRSLISPSILNGTSTPATEAERRLLDDFEEAFDIPSGTMGPLTSIFEMGITSMALISLKRRIETRLCLDVPLITLMNNPTARTLSEALDELNIASGYNPVVTLRSHGSKAPLWLVHPGVGEVLVFLGLANLISDRPVYALRARGFDGEPHFTDLADMIGTYYEAIRRKQPTGPYALAGYSYGSMVAFELAKRLEADGEEVKFLGSFNLPPHIKQRMRQLSWNMCLLHLAYFLGLTTEQFADDIEDSFRELPRESAMATVLEVADEARMAELGLDERKLANWAQLAFSLQSLAVDYEPSGSVGLIDVFHARPLRVAAKSREDWLENHLSKWKHFCRTEPRFHEVGGAHYTMIGKEYVVGFARVLNRALEERGV